MPSAKTNTLPKIFSCSKCGEAYGANPPDDVHTLASVDPHPSMDIDPLMVKAVPYACENCNTITTLYWIDRERLHLEEIAQGGSLTEEEYQYKHMERLKCRECGEESWTRLVSYGAQHLVVCQNEKCRRVLAVIKRTRSGVFTGFTDR